MDSGWNETIGFHSEPGAFPSNISFVLPAEEERSDMTQLLWHWMASLEGGKLLYPPLPPSLTAWEMLPVPLLLPVSFGALAVLV